VSGVLAIQVLREPLPRDDLARAAARMARSMAHRGAMEAVVTTRAAALGAPGERVLERGPFRAALDVRLDRRDELRERLAASVDATDAELLLAAWDRWGDDAVLQAEGDFAGAIWDERGQELILLRDPLGVRPLYFARSGDVVVVASEVQALEASGHLPPLELDRLQAARYLVSEYGEERATIFAGVEVAPPGSIVRWRDGLARRRRMWWPDTFTEARPADPASCGARLREALDGAVRSRMVGQHPAAVLVSGGLDSSSVACLAARHAAAAGKAPPALLHMAFPGLTFDEDAYFRTVVEATGAQAIEVDPRDHPAAIAPRGNRTGPGELFEPTLAILEPLLDAAALPRGTPLLNGFGGDDLLYETGSDCVDALRQGQLALAVATARVEREGAANAARYLAREALRAVLPGPIRSAIRRRRPADRVWPAWFDDGIRRDLHAWHVEREDWRDAIAAPSEVQRRLAAALLGDSDLFVFLSRLDRLAARRGIELRYPFYDRRVIEVLLATPPLQRANHRELKGVLREGMRGILPERVRTRPDAAAFAPRLLSGCDGPHRELYVDALGNSELERRGVVQPGQLLAMFEQRGPALPILQAFGIETALRTLREARASDV
jgi:asparagine synthase (glutamine-hydrolysing)